MWKLWQAAGYIEVFFAENGGNGRARMRGAFGKVTFRHANIFWRAIGYHHVRKHSVYLLDGFDRDAVIHEMGHVFDNSFGKEYAAWFGGGPADEMARALGGVPEICIARFDCSLVAVIPFLYRDSYNTPLTEPLPPFPNPGSYARRGPSEDFAVTFEREIAHRSSDGFVQRAQWLRNYIALQTTTIPSYSNLPYPSSAIPGTSTSSRPGQ